MVWDRMPAKRLASLQDELVRHQVRTVLAPYSPLWRTRFAELGRGADPVATVEALATLPALGERDVSPAGDAAGMAALVVGGGEVAHAVAASGPDLRRALRHRMTNRDRYRSVVDSETRPTSYLWDGLAFSWPVASTRGDLDRMARAGARLWQVLGLGRDDVLLSAAAPATRYGEGLALAAIASGAPAVHRPDVAAFAEAAALLPPTVLALPADSALSYLEATGPLPSVRTVLMLGAPAGDVRAAVTAAVGGARVLLVHAPSGARLLWGECAPGSGLHTYPDLEVVQTVDPESGEPTSVPPGPAHPAELVLTQVGGWRGSALLRWRTGDLVDAPLATGACPSCGRTVPRVPSAVRAGVLVRQVGRLTRNVDFRSITAAIAGRPEVADWRLLLGRRRRDGRGQLLAHLVVAGDPLDAVAALAADIRTTAGMLPSQLVVSDRATLAEIDRRGEPLTARVRLDETSGAADTVGR